jgi:hypothetical protein
MSNVAATNAALVFFVAKYDVTKNVTTAVKTMASKSLKGFFTVNSNVEVTGAARLYRAASG